MSDLQIGLIVLGVALIVVVLGLNWWQDRRVRNKMQATFSPAQEDPLLGDAAPEPVVKTKPVKKAAPVPTERVEPAWQSAVADDAAPDADDDGVFRREPAVGAATLPRGDVDQPDTAVEALIDLGFARPVPGRDLLPLVRELDRVGQKPLRVFLRTVDGDQFLKLRLDRDYVSLQIAVLLANRSGALTASEWAQAWSRAERIAEQLDASIEGPDPAHVAEHARQLDELCAALDTSVGLTLVPQRPQPWRVAEVLAQAHDAGFVEGTDPDRLEWRDDQGAVRFVLVHPASEARGGAVAGRVSLLLDVPRHAASDTAFADMAHVARQLADVLEAGVVDDNGQPLADGSEGAVDAHLRRLYGQLAENGLKAGSPRAVRVFA